VQLKIYLNNNNNLVPLFKFPAEVARYVFDFCRYIGNNRSRYKSQENKQVTRNNYFYIKLKITTYKIKIIMGVELDNIKKQVSYNIVNY